MKKAEKRVVALIFAVFMSMLICSCGTTAEETPDKNADPADKQPAQTEETKETPGSDEEDYTEGFGDTFSGETSAFEEESGDSDEDEDGSGDETVSEDKDVDLIFFMGQSNMSGAGGDASLAPFISEKEGMEFRAVSDPTKLYPITEPFGINENNPTGLNEYPGAKKGSMVSSFVYEYYKLCKRRVVAVSMSMGATDMTKWNTPGVTEDIRQRFDASVNYLNSSGYKIGHMYAVWLHGESDGIEGTDPEVYRTALDDIMRPLFIGGVRKVFIITPGRTIDYRDIFLDIINMQKKICAESDYYAIATTVLTKVSTEYMKDQYHYNQHVLNMVGIESAKAVAYYTMHGEEMIVYDYREGKYIIPEGVDQATQDPEEPMDFENLDIESIY